MPRRQRSNADPKSSDNDVRITDFGGMAPGYDQHDNDPGQSWYQINAVSFHPGELRCRGGFRIVRYEA